VSSGNCYRGSCRSMLRPTPPPFNAGGADRIIAYALDPAATYAGRSTNAVVAIGTAP
jgi:hypothetical protein